LVAIFEANSKEKPELIILSATNLVRKSPHVWQQNSMLHLSTECRSVSFKDEGLEVERLVFSGNGVSTEIIRWTPAIVTLKSGIVEPRKNSYNGETETICVEVKPLTQTLEVR